MDDLSKDIIVESGKAIVERAYDDLAKPAAKAGGEVLGLLPRTINVAL